MDEASAVCRAAVEAKNGGATIATTSTTTTPSLSFGGLLTSGSSIHNPAAYDFDHFEVYSYNPDYAEHPKRRKSLVTQERLPPPSAIDDDEAGGEVSFWQDFVAGGLAGSASVVVGHPMDTIKVRLQNSSNNMGMMQSIKEFGGVSSLFRGMGAPLSAAAFINALVFASYGLASRLYDKYLIPPNDDVMSLKLPDSEQDLNDSFVLEHDSAIKSFSCGAFAGFVQCFIICPMEHVKVRLQMQHGKGTPDNLYKGPAEATRSILKQHGVARLFQGWSCTLWREIPAFGMYFAIYDTLKDNVSMYLDRWRMERIQAENEAIRRRRAEQLPGQQRLEEQLQPVQGHHMHMWIASIISGGMAGCVTWGMVYPVDVIKTRVQTMPLDTPRSELQMLHVGSQLVTRFGWRSLFRGMGITLIRAFPVNATIFPVYEFTLQQLVSDA